MDRGDYRFLPKGLRRMLVFSETLFFREYGKPQAPKKNQREEDLKTSSSLSLLRSFGLAVFAEKEAFPKHQQASKPFGQETVIASAHDGSTFHVSFLLNGPRGRTCTCNLPGLSGTPLLLGYTRMVPTVGFAPTVCAF